MLQHIRQIHQKNTQATCDQCSRVFTRKADLQRHLKTCTGEQVSSSNSENVKRKLPQLNYSNKKTKVDTSTKHHVIDSELSDAIKTWDLMINTNLFAHYVMLVFSQKN